MSGRRLLLDVSSTARWAGPPGGIIRLEQQLIAAARASRPDIVLGVFDPVCGQYRAVTPAWQETVFGDHGALVLADAPADPRRRGRLPRRGDLLFALEALRLTTPRPWLASAIDRLERTAARLTRHSIQMFGPDGARFSYVPGHLALGDVIPLGRGDVVLTAGYDWLRKPPARIAALKAATGLRYIVTCYDMIPLLRPEFYDTFEVEGFRRYWHEVLPMADRVLVISQFTHDSLVTWAGQHGLPVPAVSHVTIGSSIGAPGAEIEPTLPAGLLPGRFVLMVGTIEPRKGHRLILDLWRELLAEGIPQRAGHVLVFVGRPGWKTASLIADIEATAGPHFMHIADAWDARLERLYRDAAFCLMPSEIEGFGLPVVEAFAHGKATLASTGGALPEVVGDLSPCLPVSDRARWKATITRWLESGDDRVAYERRIADVFERTTISQIADSFWDAADHTGRLH